MQVTCLRLKYDRKSGGQIAVALGISKGTVNSHLAQARRVLGVATSVEAAALLPAWEAQTAPCELPTQPARVPSADLPEPVMPSPSSVPTWHFPLPFRPQGATANDLTLRQRLFWIGALPIALATSFGLLVIALRIISDVARAALR
jgi:DNA-binding CsgD family transcriptional regulator